ncbi:MAG: HD domain-containing protein [Sedimentisphaerales bacterium]|nr:HD domain-containing protein [Sedimentisphaerales bacterium]
MEQRQLDEFRDWFEEYVAGFYGDDEYINANVKHKQGHTLRVCQEIRHIAERVGLSAPQQRIAEAVALFHDIGRFEQFVRFRTFHDAISIRHALLGVQILKQERVLESLGESEQEWILKAVEYHADKQLPKDLDGPCLIYAQLIRDADKLDIYKVIMRYYKRRMDDPLNDSLGLGFPDPPEYSPHVVEKLLRGESIDYSDLRSLNDMRLVQLGWVHDINFTVTLEQIKERRYLETLISFLPDMAETKTIGQRIFSIVDEKLKRKNKSDELDGSILGA